MKHEVEIVAHIRNCRFTVEVEADTPEDAVKKARENMSDNWYGQSLMLAAESADTEVESVEIADE